MNSNYTIIIIKRFITIGLAAVCFFIIIYSYTFCYNELKGKANMTGGYISKKEVVYSPATYFRSGVTEYILYIDGEYINGLNKPTAYTKKYIVDKDIYNEYKIGDYFDSEDVTNIEEKEQ